MTKSILVLVVISLLILGACAGTPTPAVNVEVVGKKVQVAGGSYTDVSVAELQTMLVNKDFIFVNVHIPDEGKIPGTDLAIPYDQIAQNLDKLPEKTTKIVLYCRSGRMSVNAAEALVSRGYSNVWNLSGGMAAWEQAGLTIEQ